MLRIFWHESRPIANGFLGLRSGSDSLRPSHCNLSSIVVLPFVLRSRSALQRRASRQVGATMEADVAAAKTKEEIEVEISRAMRARVSDFKERAEWDIIPPFFISPILIYRAFRSRVSLFFAFFFAPFEYPRIGDITRIHGLLYYRGSFVGIFLVLFSGYENKDVFLVLEGLILC